MEVELIPVDPAQNYTIFVTTPIEPALRPKVAAALMKRQDPPAEQVAFISADSHLPRMEMMGGEFCGNASRSFGMLTAMERGLEKGSVTVSVSGCTQPLTVDVDLSANIARVEMPLQKTLHQLKAAGRSLPILAFEGLCHAVVEAPPDAELAQQIINKIEDSFSTDAIGVIFLQRNPLYITPVVYVPATGSTVWEHSCGSGSLAAALWMAMQQPHNGLKRFSFQQPGGLLEIELEMKDGRVTAARLGGPVTIGQKKCIHMEL
ncbi:MAG: hypothetical protein IKU72_04480 [Oscillospiraceae bacterium]|nr:hypothetical protein [Oscillospiraceae bacterium]